MEEQFLPPPAAMLFSGGGVNWTKDENKMFESTLAVFDKDTPDRWIKVAALIPGKSARDVENKYRELLEDITEIETGRVSIPGYGRDFEGCRKRPSGDHKTKKGVPWTEEEHSDFSLSKISQEVPDGAALFEYGKGDWSNISRNFVIAKTPTQVASLAQKYFIRQLSGIKDKTRPSIHDITSTSLTESSSDNSSAMSLDYYHPDVLTTEQKLAIAQGLVIGHCTLENN